jgi:hypothetical protein
MFPVARVAQAVSPANFDETYSSSPSGSGSATAPAPDLGLGLSAANTSDSGSSNVGGISGTLALGCGVVAARVLRVALSFVPAFAQSPGSYRTIWRNGDWLKRE